ncbi:hypothetical protein BBP40_011206 [Aspergillus hancockii]|nr:hypothetical protein BBP40_011206 [Aspergillus hancockii]
MTQSSPYKSEKDDSTFIEDVHSLKQVDEKGQGDYSGATKKTDPEEIRLVRKLDIRIMPSLWSMYFLNDIDRNAIANARLNNLEDDLGLHGTQYNTCISILFVGYLLMQIPSNMLMSSKKVRPSIYMSVCRGITEAPFYPGALFLLSLLYKRKEIALRISILYTGNIIATAVAGLIAAATFATLEKAHGLADWQWLFIIEGVVTFAVAALGLFMLPDHPLTICWLTPEERQLAHDRIFKDTVSGEEPKGVAAGLKEAFCDPRLFLMAFMQNMHLSACGFNNFFPTVIGSLGFNRTITLVLTYPPYIISGLTSIVIGITSGGYNEHERTWHITGGMGVAVVGFVISCSVNSVILGWGSASLGQTPEKKAASLSFINVVANASYIYTAYLYPDTDGPRYLTAMASNAAFGCATIVGAWVWRLWLQSTNNKIKRGALPAAYRARKSPSQHLWKIASRWTSRASGKGKLAHSIYDSPKIMANTQKQRTYFDSGDLALSAAHAPTDDGDVQPGTAHPVRKSISHPNAPVPYSSNVSQYANYRSNDKRSASPEGTTRPSARHTESGPTNSSEERRASVESSKSPEIDVQADHA